MQTVDLDKEISRRFASLRSEDLAHAPSMPALNANKLPTGVHSDRVLRPMTIAASLAFVMIAGVLVFLSNSRTQDAASIYSAISPAWPSATDHLLVVSSSTLPGMAEWPDIFDQSYIHIHGADQAMGENI